MSYLDLIQGAGQDAERLERTFREANRAGEGAAFAEAVEAGYAAAPDNLLYAAWHFRLAYAAAAAKRRIVAWGWAIPLAIVNGLLLWLLSDQRFSIQITDPAGGTGYPEIPAVALLAAPICAVLVLVYLAAAGARDWRRVGLAALGLALGAAYVLLVYRGIGPRVFQEQYLGLMVPHLALLAWAAVGATLLARHRDAENRFAFLIDSLQVAVLAGLFAIAGALFTAITFGLFQALGMELPEPVMRLFVFGGAGTIAVLAVAMLYDPTEPPRGQAFEEGLSKLIAGLLRLMLPLAVGVGLIYLGFIPFHFRQPFENREVLVIYNVMLFAVIALLVGATPLGAAELGERGRTWLRRGIIALAAVALVVSVYALVAIVYRSAVDRLTPNRLAIVGWNLINIGILAWLLARQWRAGRERWIEALHRTFATSTIPYVAWTLVVILALPWLFRFDTRNVAALPDEVRGLVYSEAYPILLKCEASPHIYLLDGGAKHWIKDIPTFEAKGFRWEDVEFLSCAELAAVPDGAPIPPDAGPPPVP